MSKVIIYGLFNPINAKCFYIGKTVRDIKTRLYQHINESGTNTNKDIIIRSIIKQGKQPIIKDLLTVDDYYINELGACFWEYVERYFINYTRDVLNEPIVNVAKGGEGSVNENGTNKVIKQYDMQGNYINTFISISEASRYLIDNKISTSININCINSNIIDVLKKRRLKAYNYLWCYDGDDININKERKKYKWNDEIQVKINERRKVKEELKELKLIEIQKNKELEYNKRNTPEAIELRKLKAKEARKKYKRSDKGKAQRNKANKLARQRKKLI